jgi:hypothetical protein
MLHCNIAQAIISYIGNWRIDVMKRLRIIPGRWQRRRSLSLHCHLCSTNDTLRLIQVLFSTAGGGGPPTQFFRR